jgi:hypothetical protein
MQQLLDVLRKQGVERAFAELGLDFLDLFESRITAGTVGAYADHEWIVRNLPELGWVVNAVPRPPRLQDLFWEEWFRREGKHFHHVLYLTRPERFDGVFVAPEHDEIHPEITLGKTWYVIDETDMSPVLLRRIM